VRPRRARESAGRRAESLAALYLFFKGYRIRARRLRRPPIEIDILAQKGDTLVLVEVKFRATADAAALAPSWHDRARLARAAEMLLAEARWRDTARNARVDIVALAPWTWPRHIQNIQ
jgi:putative endonuclease